MKPVMVAAASAEATDEQLVEAARAGSDAAFEALFRRYRDRIKAHVWGMLGDEGRAEDVTQEAFISALRRLRASDQRIVFRPWIYQIARNACIDHLRRLKRTNEISIDSEDFGPSYEGRLSQAVSGTESTVSQREELDNLRQAFSGLPDTQHRVLVLRELEGLSYEEIGRRMNLSAPAVESMLFRARRGLKGEYQDISTGERCRRMKVVMARVCEGVGGVRDRRMLVRHIGDCTNCRREAALLGIGGARRRDRARAALSRLGALLPIPAFLRRRPDGAGPGANSGTVAGYARRLYELGPVGSASAEQAATAAQKAVAVIAALAVVGGGGMIAHKSGADRTASASPASSQAGGGGGGSFVPGIVGFGGGALGGGGGIGAPAAGGGSAGGGGATPTAHGFGNDPFGGGLVGLPGTAGSGVQGAAPGVSAPGVQVRGPLSPSSLPKGALPGSPLRLPSPSPRGGSGEPGLLPGGSAPLPPIARDPRKPSVDLPGSPVGVDPPSGTVRPPRIRVNPPPVATPPPPPRPPVPRVTPPPPPPPPVQPPATPSLPSAPAPSLPQAPDLGLGGQPAPLAPAPSLPALP